MEINHLTFSIQKTKAIIFKGPRKREGFSLGGNEVLLTKSARCLDIYIEDKLIFNEHVKKAIKKAAKSYSALVKLMPNIGGSSSEKRAIPG